MNKHVYLICKLTCLELYQSRAFRSLAIIILFIPLVSLLFANLFMMDIGKVFVDALAGFNHLVASVFLLFFVVPLLARDIESRVCYFLIIPPVSRLQYLLGRFTGVIILFLSLMILLIISGTLTALLLLHNSEPLYHAGLTPLTVPHLIFFQLFHYLSLIGAIFFIFGWASGMAEIMLFSSAIIFFAWIFPPVLALLNNPEAAESMPAWTGTLLDAIYAILPHLNGNRINAMLAHGIPISPYDQIAYIVEHLSYATAGFVLSALFFQRRDL